MLIQICHLLKLSIFNCFDGVTADTEESAVVHYGPIHGTMGPTSVGVKLQVGKYRWERHGAEEKL